MDALHYPWEEQTAEAWDGKVIKIRGIFNGHRFFVRRDKDGKKGFMVLAPFVTANPILQTFYYEDRQKSYIFSIVVNLGWVPEDSLKTIENEAQPVPPLVSSLIQDPIKKGWIRSNYDPYTGLALNSDNEEDDSNRNVCEIMAVVRKTEKPDILNLTWNDPGNGEMNFVDCGYLAGLFRFYNFQQASKAYLEYVVPEDQKGETFPLPGTASSLLDTQYGSKYFSGNVGKFGLLGIAGLALSAVL